ncbi:hypothetical protein PENSPDRAFT_733721 [Peniophora sp. CONT]|nr:hypothetical protein PENSPDRAFT_733721 [Peniophora sp. CONT]
MPEIESVTDNSSSGTASPPAPRPTSIVVSHRGSHVSLRNNERSVHRSSRITLDRHSKGEITALLALEEREASKLRKLLLGASEQLRLETRRADENELRAREAAMRYREIDDARRRAQKDANKANEELRLYKLQLDAAQKEIHRAQTHLNELDRERHDAEASAARARNSARHMKENLLVERAREEGRRLGIQEALAGRGVPVSNARSPGAYTYLDEVPVSGRRHRYSDEYEDSLYDSTPTPPPAPHLHPERSPPRMEPQPPPPPPPQPAPPPPPVQQQPPPVPTGMHPIPVHNMPRSPSMMERDIYIPPDGFIPVAGEDMSIRLPPPHEMSRMVSPSGSSVMLPPSPKPGSPNPMMVPNPTMRTYADSVDSRRDRGERSHRSHRRRGSSPDSVASTATSAFELTMPPDRPPSTTATGHPYSSVNRRSLSVIPESVSDGHAPSRRGDSVRGTPRARESAGDLPHVPEIRVAPPIGHHEPVYRRPSYADETDRDSESSMVRTPASARSAQRSLRSVMSGSSVPDINVEPPSRPSSQTPEGTPPGSMTGNFLSADDAHRIQTPTQPPPDLPPVIPQQPVQTIVLPDGALPPNFVPSNPAYASPSRGPQNLPPVIPPQMPGYVPAPASTSASRKSGRSARASEPTTRASSVAGVVVPDASLYNRGAPSVDSTSDTDDALSSSMASSASGLSTPPPRKAKKPKPPKSRGPAYEVAPEGNGPIYPSSPLARASGVPLPPSTMGASTAATSPRTNLSYLSATTDPNALSGSAGATPVARPSNLGGKKKKKR